MQWSIWRFWAILLPRLVERKITITIRFYKVLINLFSCFEPDITTLVALTYTRLSIFLQRDLFRCQSHLFKLHFVPKKIVWVLQHFLIYD